VLRQILIDSERPGKVGAAVADEDGFFDAAHELFLGEKER
jgi:hypothetical protein